jgi:magnesium transporter
MLDTAVSEPGDVPVRPGVVDCALYRDGHRVRYVDVEELATLAGQEGCVVWLGLHEPDQELLGLIQSQLGLHELMIEDANHAHQPPNWKSTTTYCSSCCGQLN